MSFWRRRPYTLADAMASIMRYSAPCARCSGTCRPIPPGPNEAVRVMCDGCGTSYWMDTASPPSEVTVIAAPELHDSTPF